MNAHPLFLTFPDPQVEAHYVSYQAKSFLAVMDANFVILSLVMNCTFGGIKAWKGDLEPAKDLALATIPVMIQGLLMKMRVWQKWRTPLALAMRFSRTMLFCWGAEVCLVQPMLEIGG